MTDRLIFTDADGDGDTVDFETAYIDGQDAPDMVYVSVNGRSGAYLHAASLIEALVAQYGEPDEPKRKVEDFAVEDVADPAKVALYMTARTILDPTGEGSVAAFEVENLANLIAKG